MAKANCIWCLSSTASHRADSLDCHPSLHTRTLACSHSAPLRPSLSF